MYIKVMLSGGETLSVDEFYKAMPVDELRIKIAHILNVSANRLRLFFGGKQVRSFFLFKM